ncbi:AAA family ATPase [Amycolatopsis rubida]|uniref:AAA family ATPase n=1 Tax=Amycolatopsis rubida TaxID=112413 RepID=A0ABX0C2Z6_9PSEU|nr:MULTISPECIES: AAA family ATPase [Amycolatopsis]NEC62145.1 AAA family ATPase [Amycolatopsis rubida]OAP24593.1 Tetrathionate response regulatory protein TtrR [Amycolatopsis sp. M39]
MWPAVPTLVSVRPRPAAFAGRDRELAAVAEVLGHRPAAVLVEGAPGMGKTRLLAELAVHPEFSRIRVLRGACPRLAEPFPYGPMLEALRSAGDRLGPLSPVAGALQPLLPELADVLPPAPEPLPDTSAGRHRVFRAFRELLIACGPTVLLIDDLHRADPGTGDLLRFLAVDWPPELGMVATCHTGDSRVRIAPEVPSAQVTLGPLDAAAVTAMACDLLGAPRITAEFAAKLHEYTAGIPFVAEETLRALRGVELTESALDRLEVPAALQESVSRQLSALPKTAVQFAKAAAVLDLPAELSVLNELTGLAEDEVVLPDGLVDEVDDNRYGFRHPFARKAVYAGLSASERKLLHTKAMHLPGQSLSLLAEHAHAAGRVEEWRYYAEEAADEAIAHGDTARAIDLLQAIVANADEDAVGRLTKKLSDVSLRVFRPDVHLTLEKLLEDRPLPPAVHETIRLALGMLLVRVAGRLEQGRAAVERAVAELADRPELAARGINLLALPFDGLTPLSWHEQWMRRAREVHSGLTDPELRLALTGDRIATAAHIGDGSAWAEFQAMPDTAPSVAERVQLARLWCNLADAQSWSGHLGRTEKLVAEGLRRASEAGALYPKGLIEGTEVRLAWFRGKWDGLTEATEDVRTRHPALGAIVMETSLVLGGLAAVRGEFAAARRHLANASAHRPGEGPIPVVLCAASVLIGVHLSTDDVAAACEAADVAVDAARRKGVWVWAASLVPAAAEAYTRADRWHDADAFVEEFARGIEDRDAPLATAALHAGRAVLTNARAKHLAAATLFDTAADAYAELPMPYLAAGMRERAARCRLDAGQDAATAALSQAAAAYAQLGATRDAGRCHHVLREHGAWAPSQRGRRGYGRELSPREREVAEMLAKGRTNRQIADGLFLSPRTVEQHVAKVLRKLDARSRTDVARKLPSPKAAQ